MKFYFNKKADCKNWTTLKWDRTISTSFQLKKHQKVHPEQSSEVTNKKIIQSNREPPSFFEVG